MSCSEQKRSARGGQGAPCAAVGRGGMPWGRGAHRSPCASRSTKNPPGMPGSAARLMLTRLIRGCSARRPIRRAATLRSPAGIVAAWFVHGCWRTPRPTPELHFPAGDVWTMHANNPCANLVCSRGHLARCHQGARRLGADTAATRPRTRTRRQRALQRPRWTTAKLVLQAVAPVSLQRSAKRPKRCRQRLSVRNSAAQYKASTVLIGCRQRLLRAAVFVTARTRRAVAACMLSCTTMHHRKNPFRAAWQA